MQERFHECSFKKIFLSKKKYKNQVLRECMGVYMCVYNGGHSSPSNRELQLAKKSTCWQKKRAKLFFSVTSKPLTDTVGHLGDVPCPFYCVYEVDKVMGACAHGGILKSLLLK